MKNIKPLFTLHLSPFTLPSSLFTLLLITLHLSLFTLTSCNSTTKPKTGSLSGRVILVNDTDNPSFDPIDFSGITVALYELADLDTTLIRLNYQYSNIGLQINQQTEFDHRTQKALYITQTSADGNFSIEKQKVGTYNLVIYQEGWGVRYIYNIKIDDSKSAIQSEEVLNIELYPETHLPQTQLEDFIFKEDHTYIIKNDTILMGRAQIENRCFILIDEGVRLDFHNEVSTPVQGDRWKIDVSDRFFDSNKATREELKRFQKITLNGADEIEFRNGVISSCIDGLNRPVGAISVNDMVFKQGETAFVFTGSHARFENNIVRDFKNRACYFTGDAEISKNIMIRNHDNLLINDHVYDIHDNYIALNWVGIRPVYGNAHIHNNDFVQNTYAISTLASSPLIDYNLFHGSTRYCVQTQANYVQVYFDYGNPVVNFNNFLSKDKIIISLLPDSHPGYYGSSKVGVDKDLNAKHNYWLSSNVEELVYDSEDSDKVRFRVLYNPVKNSRIMNAGIRF
ncbi:MAG: hypothetical protein PHC50_01840 [Candidatus Cloacimonetes bacterium]|nr:hypothetical protein [Candidatus Cloacimonadota bacterium]